MKNFALLPSRWLVIVSSVLLGGVLWSCTSSMKKMESELTAELQNKKLNSNAVTQKDGALFSQVIQKNIRSKPEGKREEFYKLLEKGLAARGTSKQARISADCSLKYPQEPACKFLNPNWYKLWFEPDFEDQATAPNLKLTPAESKRSRPKRPVAQTLAKNLSQGKWQPIEKQRPGDYYRALKVFNSWTDSLTQVENEILAEGTCAPTELYNFLGLKSEEFFPDSSFIARSVRLYQKADQCGENNKYTLNARFRLALLQILNEDCDAAVPVFDKVANGPMNDYSSRAKYWVAWCAKGKEDRTSFFQLYDNLFRANPLGFHTLSLARGDKVISDQLAQTIDPIVVLRTKKDPKIDAWIDAIEYMDSIGRKDLVRSLMTPIRLQIEDISQLDPAIRLYLSSFAYRSNDTLALFRILDSVFRTQAEYIVDSTLKLFYPLNYLDIIVKNSGRINPLLIAALIRQESAFGAQARSPVGAMGLMQLMPATARTMKRGLNKKALFNPELNIELGTRYFEMLVNRFNGDVELALASYNAGPEVVDRWVARYPRKNRMLFLDLIPYSETRNYVTLIGRNFYWYNQLYRKNIQDQYGLASVQPTHFSAFEPL